MTPCNNPYCLALLTPAGRMDACPQVSCPPPHHTSTSSCSHLTMPTAKPPLIVPPLGQFLDITRPFKGPKPRIFGAPLSKKYPRAFLSTVARYAVFARSNKHIITISERRPGRVCRQCIRARRHKPEVCHK
ncbi:hypothetical protein J6590_076445 [Homalodisca vitripennis]|nr:hypothetical protein J6590_076445 [Homalodisca vitripennis]